MVHLAMRRPLRAIATAAVIAVGAAVLSAPLAASAAGPTTFSNTAAIAIPATGSADDKGWANPYPSSITVSGMTGVVSAVTMTVTGLSHAALNDVDLLLVAPTGENLVVLSDLGDPNQLTTASNITMTFSDSAASIPPAQYVVPSGTYKPYDNDPGGAVDAFPAPAPSPSSDTTFAGAFAGIAPNGTWRLYAVDDASGETGSISGGWSLSLTTTTADVATTTTTVTTSGTPSHTGDPVTFTATVAASGSPVATGTVQFTDGAANIGGPVAVGGSGHATLTTSSLAEGTHAIRATYSGASGFLTSSGTVTQRVDNVTVVTGNTYCNPGVVTVPSVGPASVYPSNITVTGRAAAVSKVTATLGASPTRRRSISTSSCPARAPRRTSCS